MQLGKPFIGRREFVAGALACGGAAMLAHPAGAKENAPAPRGKADACIFLWLGGGAAQIDTFDPKGRGDGAKTPGSYYDTLETAIPGAKVCQHLSRTARLLDRCSLVRTLHHDVVDEHAAATNRLHTGRPTTGTIVYPSIGSVVAHQLPAGGEKVPRYVVMGYPNLTRGPGFLGARYSYLYLTDTAAGPSGLQRGQEISDARQTRREALLGEQRAEFLAARAGERKIEEYAAVAAEGFQLAGPEFMRVFDLASEATALREQYGGEFGQRCLLARRLVQSGVRFVEVSFNLNFLNGTGWDTHNQGQKQQHVLIEQLDQAFAALLQDLERCGRLDRTLVVIATEFGRPAQFDGGGGRGHHSKSFSGVLAGGGLKTGQVVGATDELAMKIEARPVSIPDFHATIYATLGINPRAELFDGDRPVPITDGGQPIAELFG